MTDIPAAAFSRRASLLRIVAGSALIALHPFSLQAAMRQAHLRILQTTDLHVHVFPYDYYSDKPIDTVGLARTASIIRAIRAEATNSMLLDNGDFLQGSPMGDYIAYERGMKPGDMHPIIAAMNTVGFDAATIGNHEFNYGLDFLMNSAAGADFPIVLANIATRLGGAPRDDITLFKPYVILQRTLTDGVGNTHPIRIGIIGFTPPQVMNWDRRHLEGKVEARDIVATAKAFVPEMKEAGADIIIALSHSGIGSAQETDGMENASVPVAAIDGIDAVVTGHSHLVFPSPTYVGYAAVNADAGTIHGKPATMGGFWGSHLGVIDLMLEHESSEWRVVTAMSEARPISHRHDDRSITPLVEDDRAVIEATKAEHVATLEYIRRPVGETSQPLHSYFALVADDPSVQIVSIAQTWYITKMMQGTVHDGIPILSAAAPFKAGGRGGPDYYTDVPAGAIAIKNVADLYLYPNTIRAVKVTGADVKNWLERSAGIFNRITPGLADQSLLNSDFPSYNFDVIHGLTYQIDLSQPSKYDPKGEVLNPDASRIVSLMYNGEPIDPFASFIIVTNNYRADGGGAFPGAMGDTIIFEGPDTNRDVLVRYIVENGTINPSADGAWSFAPMPNTSVLFETGAKARDYANSVTSLTLEDTGDNADGFAVFRILL